MWIVLHLPARILFIRVIAVCRAWNESFVEGSLKVDHQAMSCAQQESMTDRYILRGPVNIFVVAMAKACISASALTEHVHRREQCER